MFLDSLPHNETEYANQEIFSAVREMIDGDLGLSKEMSVREKMRVIIRSHKFHLFYIALVVLDCVCVVAQIIFDIMQENHRKNTTSSAVHGDSPLHNLELMAEGASLFILSIFLLSIVFHAVLLGKVYLRSKLEMLDAFIVIVSFVLEIISITKYEMFKEFQVILLTFR